MRTAEIKNNNDDSLFCPSAVRRSREKSKIKYNEKEEQIGNLRKENKQLESKAENLRRELAIYQDIARGLDIQVMEEVNMGNANRMIKLERDFPVGY